MQQLAEMRIKQHHIAFISCCGLMLLQVADDGDVKLVDATNAWMHNLPLYCAIVLSLVIAAMCSLLVVAMLTYMGLGMLKKVNIELQVGFDQLLATWCMHAGCNAPSNTTAADDLAAENSGHRIKIDVDSMLS